MLGRKFNCPSCGAEIEAPQGNAQSGSAQTGQDNGSRRNGALSAAEKTWIPVVCRLCGTRMHAEPHQIGEKIRCPDCFVENEVREAPPVAKAKRLELEDGYPLANGPAATKTPLFADRVDTACPSCREELSLSASLIGERFACPYCDRYFTVTGNRVSDAAVAPTKPADQDDEYDVLQPASESSPTNYGATPIETVDEPLRHRGLWEDKPPTPPPTHPFLQGVYGFPARPDCRGRVLAIASIQSAALFLGWGAVVNGSAPAAGIGSAPYWIGALFFSILATILLLSWLAVAWSSVSAIITDSANGADDVESWPTGPFTDWFGDGLPMMIAFGSAAAAGSGASWALHENLGLNELQAAPFGVAVAVAFAPIFALSVLESGSALGILSAPITASVLRTPGAWVKFFVSSSPWAVAAAAPWVLVLPLGYGGWEVAGRLAAPVLAAWAMFVYSRLLGRLGWVVMEDLAARKAEQEEE